MGGSPLVLGLRDLFHVLRLCDLLQKFRGGWSPSIIQLNLEGKGRVVVFAGPMALERVLSMTTTIIWLEMIRQMSHIIF